MMNGLMYSIRKINQQVQACIDAENYSSINELIESRGSLIRQLAAMVNQVEDKSAVIQFFLELKQDSQQFMNRVNAERTRVVEIFSNIKNLKDYEVI
jgi:flagellar hook-associated protein FlgK